MSVPSVAKTDRRNFLKYIGTAAAGVAVGVAADRYSWIPSSPAILTQTTRTERVTDTITETTTKTPSCSPSLRAAAEARGLLIGSAADENSLRYAPFGTTLAREFNFLTPEWEMKWIFITQRGYEAADTLVKFASNHQMKVKGHTLIWARGFDPRLEGTRLPDYVNENTSVADFRRAIQEHIHTLVGRYRGKVYAWDVVNEAVDDIEGLRKSLFLDKLGEGFIAEAFQLAHEADPDALLIYNDYGAEGMGGKSDRVYTLVKKLVADNVPIHGVGLQMHINATGYPTAEHVAANVRRLAALGLKVNISEMDVRIRDVPGDTQQKLEVQRQVYRDIVSACVKVKGFMAATFWGFTDAHSWVDSFYGPDDPLLLDEYYKPKPAYWGVMEALLSG